MLFSHPALLWGLLLVLPLAWVRNRREARLAVAFAPAQVGPSPPRAASWAQRGLEVLIIALCVAALAGPGRVDVVESISEEGLDVILVLDISASMQAADFEPNRLEALKEIARDFLRRAGGNRIGIHAFAKASFTQSPLTTDHRILLELLDGLAYESIDHVESGGTAIGDALLVATDTLESARIEGRDRVILLISDGESHIGIDPLLAARHLGILGIRLHVVGIGGDEEVEVLVHGEPFINTQDEILTTSLDDTQLREIAAAANGTYARALDRDVLSEIFNQFSRLERTPIEVRTVAVHSSWTPYLAALISLVFSGWLALTAFTVRRPLR